jgi:hypothetical protein
MQTDEALEEDVVSKGKEKDSAENFLLMFILVINQLDAQKFVLQ